MNGDDEDGLQEAEAVLMNYSLTTKCACTLTQDANWLFINFVYEHVKLIHIPSMLFWFSFMLYADKIKEIWLEISLM